MAASPRPPSLALIGRTPVVDLSALVDRPGNRLLGKLEGYNLAGSVKDRPAMYMVEDAEESRRLRPGMTILEASSGNTGIALAMLARVKGYEACIVAPENMTRERKELLGFYGARLVETPASGGTKVSIQQARHLAETDPSLCWLNQYANPANPRAHFETTGAEILRDVPDVDVLVAGIGSGGTIMGAGRRLRLERPGVQLIGVEPDPATRVFGLRNIADDAFVPPILDLGTLDGRLLAHGREAFEMVRRVGRQFGVFIGMSAGATLASAVRYVSRAAAPTTVCAVLADSGWKYLSMGLGRDVSELGADVESVLEHSW